MNKQMPHILCIDRITCNLHIYRNTYNMCKDWMTYNLDINRMTYNLHINRIMYNMFIDWMTYNLLINKRTCSLCVVLNVTKLLFNKTANSICCETTKDRKIQKQKQTQKQNKITKQTKNNMV